jgi:hypothetical protein
MYMMQIAETYKKATMVQPDRFLKFYGSIEEKIILALSQNGLSTSSIENVLIRQSPLLKNRLKTEVEKYLRKVPYTVNQSSTLADTAYQEEKDRFAHQFAEFYIDKDAKIINALFSAGYHLKEVRDAVFHYSYFAQQIHNAKEVGNYCDQVMTKANSLLVVKSGKMYELAEKNYEATVQALSKKYSNYDRQHWNEFQEGKVALSMLLQRHYMPDIIAAVLKNHSCFSRDKNVIEAFIEKCNQVKTRYLEIKKVHEPVRTAVEAYLLAAKKYMAYNRISVLNGKDDQNLAQQLLKMNLPMEEIMQALRQASPVSVEPGRDPDSYLHVIMTCVEDAAQRKKNYLDKKYQLTAAIYDQKMESKDAFLHEKYKHGIEQNRTLYDGLVARELIEEKHLDVNVRRVILDKSPQAKKVNPNNPNRTPEGYANWIVRAAHKVIDTEKAILTFTKEIPSERSYQSLQNRGITLSDLFRKAYFERVQAYPSVAGKLTSGFMDKDICEKLLSRFPDISRTDLENVIHECSPRAQMPGIPLVYPVLVMDETVRRVETQNLHKAHTESIQSEYNRQYGLAAEGVNATANMAAYQQGRAALSMLTAGVSSAEIKQAMFDDLAQEAIPDKFGYIENIMEHASNVYARMQALETINSTDKATTAQEVYMHRLADQAKNRKAVHSSMDIDIMSEMLYENKFTAAEIRTVIKENSPIATEAGRDPEYVEQFVEPRARDYLAKEEEKLYQYRPVPRINHEPDAVKEYVYHKEQLQRAIQLPWVEKMDTLVASTMLIQGFGEEAIADAIDQGVPENCRCGLKAVHAALEIQQAIELAVKTPIKNTIMQNVVRTKTLLAGDDS